MNSDIRVSTTFFFHRKTKKLYQTLKDHGVLCLLKLWTRVAIEKPCGILSGWTIEDIEIEADFTGERGRFVTELLRLGLLDEKDGIYILHNWDERQGWVSKSKERGNKARLSRMAKTHKDIYKQLVNNGYKSLTRKEYDKLTIEQRNVNETLTTINEAVTPAPAPSPSPSPKKNTALKNAAQKESIVFYLTKKKRKLTGKRLETFDQFWEAFDYKRGRAEAADSWLDIPELTNGTVEKIIMAAKIEAGDRPEMIANKKTPKMAQGWLSGKRWEDEIIKNQQESKKQYVNWG